MARPKEEGCGRDWLILGECPRCDDAPESAWESALGDKGFEASLMVLGVNRAELDGCPAGGKVKFGGCEVAVADEPEPPCVPGGGKSPVRLAAIGG